LTVPSTAAASIGRANWRQQRRQFQPAASIISNRWFLINFTPLVKGGAGTSFYAAFLTTVPDK
jgi:hypothetical protein